MHARVQRAGAVVLLGWCVWSGSAALRGTFERDGDDERAQLEAALHDLAAQLPPRGTIGYLGPDATSTFTTMHAAQYALVPRVLAAGTGQEYVIVADEARPSGRDATLPGYEPTGPAAGGHRAYRRLR
jgi:hypothetical protein